MPISKLFENIPKDLASYLTADSLITVIRHAVLIILVLITFQIIRIVVGRLLKGRLPEQNIMIVRKFIRYAGFVVATMTLFDIIGIDLSAVLGAAGIAGIAIGFAAQTSVSNVISGLFLISEKPFQVGDAIQVGEVMGIVQSVDFLSIKIQTYDNRFIRVPNETIIKTNVVNITRFPIRRFDLWISVSYSEDLERVRSILEELARENVYVLDNPEPIIVFDKFDTSGINILFGLWFEKTSFLSLKNSMMIDIRKRFKQEGISIPFPQLDVHLRDVSGAAMPKEKVL
ncbi:mechanosensitive ion channel [Treponema sp.]